jgi:hypothetical protein
LDSSEIPAAPVLLAEVEGELRAALSLSDGAIVADPFHPTAGLVLLLERWAQMVLGGRSRRLRRLRRILTGRVRRQREAAGTGR